MPIPSITQIEVRPYTRPFQKPLRTHHGLWCERRGLLIRVKDAAGREGFGDVAPIPWFGSETLEQAIAFWQQMAQSGAIAPPPSTVPASQFAWAMALADCQGQVQDASKTPPSCALLPTGAAAQQAWHPLWDAGRRHFKWKIGVASLPIEQDIFRQLMSELPTEARLRLDANGGLSVAEAERWLALCADYPSVEFLEQPLPPSEFEAMQQLADRFPTPLALDESVATVAHLKQCHQRGWTGIFVVKPGIAGFPQDWLAYSKTHQLQMVLSSVLEWAIARRYIQHVLLPALPNPRFCPGLDVGAWFLEDALDTLPAAALWNHLAP